MATWGRLYDMAFGGAQRQFQKKYHRNPGFVGRYGIRRKAKWYADNDARW